MLAILGFLLMGLVVGALARLLVPGRQPMGIIKTMLLGCAGSLLVGTATALIFHGTLDIRATNFFGALLGAVVVLLLVMRRRRITV